MSVIRTQTAQPIPAAAGIGLRAPHVQRVLAERPAIPWLEMHSENLFGAGGAMVQVAERLRSDYPLSFHGVGLSLGSADALDGRHLSALKTLVNRFEPGLVSDHISWGAIGGVHSNDLLPMPFTEEALDLMVERVQQVQDAIGREFLVENVSSYLQFRDAPMREWEFVAELVRRSGCGLLLDINNVYVNSVNHGFDALAYLRSMPGRAIRELHLAGFTRKDLAVPLLIDTHSAPVDTHVWALYAEAVDLFGAIPTLVEWDQDIPELEVLLAEADRAQSISDERLALPA